MTPKERFKDRTDINEWFTAFDVFTSKTLSFGDQQVCALPECQRLTDYFLANAGDAEIYLAHGSAHINIDRDPQRGGTSSEIRGPNKTWVRAGNCAILQHELTNHTTHTPLPYYYDELWVMNGDTSKDPQARLYSANVMNFPAGHDFSRINTIGSVISVVTPLFEDFVGRRKSSLTVRGVQEANYSITPSSSSCELVITPGHAVHPGNFGKATSDVVALTNQALRVLGTETGLPYREIRTPEK